VKKCVLFVLCVSLLALASSGGESSAGHLAAHAVRNDFPER
jgi:hypothetical protein